MVWFINIQLSICQNDRCRQLQLWESGRDNRILTREGLEQISALAEGSKPNPFPYRVNDPIFRDTDRRVLVPLVVVFGLVTR